MNTTPWLLTLAGLLVVGGAASAADDLPQAMGHAADKAKEMANAHSILNRAGADDAGADAGDARCDEFDNHGAYVSSVAQDNETRSDDGSRHGEAVRGAAQSDVGKCSASPNGDDAAADDDATEDSETADADTQGRSDDAHGDDAEDDGEDDRFDRGRSDEARDNHPPQRP